MKIDKAVPFAPCAHCMAGKSHIRPYMSDWVGEHPTVPFSLCSFDLLGKMPVRSLGGSYHTLTIVEHSRHIPFTYHLATKDKIHDCLAGWYAWVKMQTGYEVKRMRFD